MKTQWMIAAMAGLTLTALAAPPTVYVQYTFDSTPISVGTTGHWTMSGGYNVTSYGGTGGTYNTDTSILGQDLAASFPDEASVRLISSGAISGTANYLGDTFTPTDVSFMYSRYDSFGMAGSNLQIDIAGGSHVGYSFNTPLTLDLSGSFVVSNYNSPVPVQAADLSGSFDAGSSGNITTSAVPEPGEWGMIGAAACGVFGIASRRLRKRA